MLLLLSEGGRAGENARMNRNIIVLLVLIWAVIFDMTGIVGGAEPTNQVLSLNGTSAYVSVPVRRGCKTRMK